jgi:hypothetical protein
MLCRCRLSCSFKDILYHRLLLSCSALFVTATILSETSLRMNRHYLVRHTVILPKRDVRRNKRIKVKFKVKVKVILQPTVSQSWCQAPIRDQRPIFLLLSLIIFRQLRIYLCGAPSLIRSRVCSFQLLLGIASTTFLRSHSHRAHEHILSSLFFRLLQPGGPGSCIYFPQEHGSPVITLSIGLDGPVPTDPFYTGCSITTVVTDLCCQATCQKSVLYFPYCTSCVGPGVRLHCLVSSNRRKHALCRNIQNILGGGVTLRRDKV